MERGEEKVAKRKLTKKERENYLRIKERLFELYDEDGKLRAELAKMGLKTFFSNLASALARTAECAHS